MTTTLNLLDFDARQHGLAPPSDPTGELLTPDPALLDRIAAGVCRLRYANDQERAATATPPDGTAAP